MGQGWVDLGSITTEAEDMVGALGILKSEAFSAPRGLERNFWGPGPVTGDPA